VFHESTFESSNLPEYKLFETAITSTEENKYPVQTQENVSKTKYNILSLSPLVFMIHGDENIASKLPCDADNQGQIVHWMLRRELKS